MTVTTLQTSTRPRVTNSSPPQERRVWTALAAIPSAFVLGIALQAAALIALLITRFDWTSDRSSIDANVGEIMSSPLGIVTIVGAVQLGFLGTALLGGYLSRTPLRKRLGLGARRPGAVDSLLAVLGTLFVAQVAALVIPLFWGGPSQHMAAMREECTSQSGVWAFVIVASFSLLPGICEELLCRGYLQRRLLNRWSPAVAIGVSSVLFGALHLDPQHMVVATIIGLWLGYVAWRTDSIWLSMICHVANNATWLTIMNLTQDDSPTGGSYGLTDPVSIAFISITGLAFFGSVRRLRGRA